ncbi:MAG: TAXI family TRAP transporter solute-binding subunit [Candidatus Wallbacteria bacterium]|nr:TAXI family TRAP transporter solute-binding subunit [Candidatus Wallbacteria bacterium]
MKVNKLVLVLLLSCLNFAGAGEALQIVSSKQFYSIATASINGTYYPVGLALSKLFNSRLTQIVTLAEPTTGSVDNIKYLDKGDAAFAIVQSDVLLDAFKGQGKFEQPVTKLRVVLSLYPEIIHVIVLESSEIRSIADLKGKNIVPGAQGSGSAVNAEFVLKYFELKSTDYNAKYMEFTKATDALQNGYVDAIFWTGGIPGEGVSMLAKMEPIRILSFPDPILEKISSEYSCYSKETIPAGTYGQKFEIHSLGLRAILATTDNIDEEMIHSMLSLIFDNTPYLATLHPRAADIKLSEALKGISIRMLHPGARKYFQQKGFLGD